MTMMSGSALRKHTQSNGSTLTTSKLNDAEQKREGDNAKGHRKFVGGITHRVLSSKAFSKYIEIYARI